MFNVWIGDFWKRLLESESDDVGVVYQGERLLPRHASLTAFTLFLQDSCIDKGRQSKHTWGQVLSIPTACILFTSSPDETSKTNNNHKYVRSDCDSGWTS